MKRRLPESPIGIANAALIVAILLYAVIRAATGEGVHLTDSVSAQAGNLLAFSLMCGLLAYGTLETTKRITRLRAWLQLQQTRQWLTTRKHGSRAFNQLLELLGLYAFGPDTLRVFDLPVEQLAAQIGGATDVALNDRTKYQILITTLASPTPYEQLEEADMPSEHKPLEPTDAEHEEDFLFAQRVRAGIDRLQISLGEQWRRAVQGATIWIAGLYGIGLVHAADLPGRAEPRYVLAALLLGGPIAWTLRDAAALLERARR
jgi:hypothetical protein